jgi:hypothetical protein
MKGKTLQEMSCRKQNKNQLMLDKFEKLDKQQWIYNRVIAWMEDKI